MLKMGTTSLILALIESGFEDFSQFDLANPVAAMSKVSYDTSMKGVLPMANGRSMRAIDIQFAYLDAVRSHLYAHSEPDPDSAEILELWQQTLDSLNDQTGEHAVAARYIDWIAKFALMQGYRDRDSLGWDSPRLSLIDLQYSDIDPAR
jgi:proteasome accessory factor A